MPPPPDHNPGGVPQPPAAVAAPRAEPPSPQSDDRSGPAETESLRRSLLASSKRVHELDAALTNARELLDLRAHHEEEQAVRLEAATDEITRLRRRVLSLRRRLARREKALRQAAKRDARLSALERSPAYRVARRGARWPLIGGLLRRALPTRRG